MLAVVVWLLVCQQACTGFGSRYATDNEVYRLELKVNRLEEQLQRQQSEIDRLRYAR